jgi:hypothetical protein
MFAFFVNAWPGKAEAWMRPEVFELWEKSLMEYTDGLVEQSVYDLMRSPGRDQQWPPTLAELLTQIERTRQYHGQFGREL